MPLQYPDNYTLIETIWKVTVFIILSLYTKSMDLEYNNQDMQNIALAVQELEAFCAEYLCFQGK